MKGLVSVVITTHERKASILKEAIESVLNQTYTDIELIVVNDAPDYLDREKIDSLVKEYNTKVNYIINYEGGGANASRNLGALKAKGEFISFLDDDDYWRIDRIEKVVNALNDGYDVVYHDIIIFDEKRERRLNRFAIAEDKLLECILCSNDWGGFSSVTIRKAAFDDVGKLDVSVKSQQDTDLWIRLAQKYRAVYINEPLTFYRLSDDAISVNEKKKIEGLYHLLEKYNDLYKRYPECEKIKLKDEMILFLKNGWTEGSKQLYKELKKKHGVLYAQKAYFIGFLKRIITSNR